MWVDLNHLPPELQASALTIHQLNTLFNKIKFMERKGEVKVGRKKESELAALL